MQIPVPYLRLERDQTIINVKEDSVYNFSEKLCSDNQIFTIDSAQHEDFTCLPQVVAKSGNCKPNQFFNIISKLTISYLEDHLKNRNTFTQTIKQELNKTIRKK